MINPKLEQVNKLRPDVFLVPSDQSYGGSFKRRCLNNRTVGDQSTDEIFPGDTTNFIIPPASADVGTSEVPTMSSWVSGCNTDPNLQSTLLPKDVLDKYLVAEEKVRVEFRSTCQNDHLWSLKTMEANDVTIIKLHFGECAKDFGSVSIDHSKVVVHNLCSNCKKSHMLTITHMKNWCGHELAVLCDVLCCSWYEEHMGLVEMTKSM